MTLFEVINKLSEFNREYTIYAVEPWSLSSAAVVEAEPQSGGVPTDAEKHGMTYFLEVFIAQDFLEDWQGNLPKKPSATERCQRVIDYAVNDA